MGHVVRVISSFAELMRVLIRVPPRDNFRDSPLAPGRFRQHSQAGGRASDQFRLAVCALVPVQHEPGLHLVQAAAFARKANCGRLRACRDRPQSPRRRQVRSSAITTSNLRNISKASGVIASIGSAPSLFSICSAITQPPGPSPSLVAAALPPNPPQHSGSSSRPAADRARPPPRQPHSPAQASECAVGPTTDCFSNTGSRKQAAGY